MKQTQVDVKRRLENDRHTQNGGEDDGGVTEDHGDDEADKNGMKNRIVSWTCDLRAKGKALVVAAKRPGEKTFIYNPTADLILEPGLVLVLLASLSDLQNLRPLFVAK